MAQLHLPKLHTAQKQIISEARRFNILDCGRRFGKDILGHRLLINTAIRAKPTAWYAPTYRMMLDTFRDVTHILQPIATKVNASDHRIELATGGVIDFWSLDAGETSRGRKYARVVINEAAMINGLENIWNMTIRPTLADLQGDAFFLSTPRGLNFFKLLYDLGTQGGEYNAWQFPTSANPFIKQTEIDAMRATMPERAFKQEILAQFIGDDGLVFRFVRDAATAQAQEPQANRGYVIGVDWGRTNDATVFCAIDADAKSVVHLDRVTDTDYNTQRARLAALARRYNHAAVLAEANAMGLPNIEALQRDGVAVQPFNTTSATKAQIIDALILGFESREIKIPNDATLINELEAYESERLPSGAIRYGAPAGMHDDTVMALALAWHGLSVGKASIDWA